MNSFSGIVLLLVVAPFLVAGSRDYRMGGVNVTHPEGPHTRSSLGRVHGVRPCGGPGKVTEWRVEDCFSDSICQVSTDEHKTSELDFIPSENIEQLGVRINMVENGQPRTVFEQAIRNSAVQAGEQYTVNSWGRANKKYKGKTVTIQYILYRVADGSAETCAEADFEIV